MTPDEIKRARIRFSGYNLSACLIKLDDGPPAYLVASSKQISPQDNNIQFWRHKQDITGCGR